ncbi:MULTISPECIES: hypothetical protein [Kaistia]|uniref:Uncharacterized protein n=1 Tax=Kaistia nematophila TaxID=2994654 RepID=A0A9X3E5K4_9HYPH|nr:hypothetical protein [Kaistia nematophila]MCX5571538.1 hypothetical protein [Kaistia nematophila]
MHIIIGMPAMLIIMGMPMPIMLIMRLQQSMNMSLDMPSIGIISQVMPLSVMVQVIFAIIIGMGIMPPIGIILPIMGIMPFIMPMPGIMFCIGIGIMAGIGIICMALLIFPSPGRSTAAAVHVSASRRGPWA